MSRIRLPSIAAAAAGWRHAWHEAGYRLRGMWSDFVDWLHSA